MVLIRKDLQVKLYVPQQPTQKDNHRPKNHSLVVSPGQTTILAQGAIACSISASAKRVWNSSQGSLVLTCLKCQYVQKLSTLIKKHMRYK